MVTARVNAKEIEDRLTQSPVQQALATAAALPPEQRASLRGAKQRRMQQSFVRPPPSAGAVSPFAMGTLAPTTGAEAAPVEGMGDDFIGAPQESPQAAQLAPSSGLRGAQATHVPEQPTQYYGPGAQATYVPERPTGYTRGPAVEVGPTQQDKNTITDTATGQVLSEAGLAGDPNEGKFGVSGLGPQQRGGGKPLPRPTSTGKTGSGAGARASSMLSSMMGGGGDKFGPMPSALPMPSRGGKSNARTTLITKAEGKELGMGWKQRTALNKQILSNQGTQINADASRDNAARSGASAGGTGGAGRGLRSLGGLSGGTKKGATTKKPTTTLKPITTKTYGKLGEVTGETTVLYDPATGKTMPLGGGGKTLADYKVGETFTGPNGVLMVRTKEGAVKAEDQ